MNLEYEQARELRNALSRQGWGRRDATREVVRIRDNRTCKLCGRQWQFGERRFDVHHLNGICGKKSRAYDKLEDMNTLLTLCHKCHLSMDSVREKMRVNHKINPKRLEELKKRYEEIRKFIWFDDRVKTFREASRTFSISRYRVSRIIRYGEKMGWDGFGREVGLTSLENQLQ